MDEKTPLTLEMKQVIETENKNGVPEKSKNKWEILRKVFKQVKICVLTVVLLTFCIIFATQKENPPPKYYPISIYSNVTIFVPRNYQSARLQLNIKSPLSEQLDVLNQQQQGNIIEVFIILEQYIGNQTFFQYSNTTMYLNTNETEPIEEAFLFQYPSERSDIRILLETNTEYSIPLIVEVLHQTVLIEYQVLIAFIIFIGVYSLIIFDVVARPLAGLIGVIVGISVLSLLQQRPSIREMAGFVDWGALGLVFGMMLIFGIIKKSGIFEWAAFKAYKLSGGRMWPLVIIMSLFCFFISVFLDNVTLMLLMTPITFQICEVIGINPLPLLITECLFGNIGGAGTPMAEEFVLILNNPGMQKFNISFAKSFAILLPGAFLGAIFCFLPIRISNNEMFKKKNAIRPEKLLLLEQIRVWKRTLLSYENEEDSKRNSLEENEDMRHIRETLIEHIKSLEDQANSITGEPNLEKMESQYVVHNKSLLIKSSIVLFIVLVLFFIESYLEPYIHLSLPWISLMGATTLILFSGINEVEHIFEDCIEWPTMIFFVTLFILIECVNRMGMMRSIGDLMGYMISSINPSWRIFFSISVILWISAFVSSLVDNVPFITGMIPVLLQLAKPPMSLPIEPLVFSLYYGVVVGGSGTLIGCAGNVVVADLSKKRGYPITFIQFLKVSAPFTFVCVFIIWIYLIVLYALIGI